MDRFAYLLITIPFLVLLGLIFYKRPDLRRFIIRIGIMGGIAGIISEAWYFQDYWRPQTLLGTGVASIEDFLFGFGVVGLGAALPLFILKQPPVSKTSGRTKRLLIIVIGAVAALVLFTSLLGVNSIVSSYFIFLGIAVAGIVKWPRLWKPMLVSAGGLIVTGAVTYWLVSLTITPGYLEEAYLIHGHALAPIFFGFLPLTELIWFAGWGFAAAALPYLINNPDK
jgi:hypothetical protein